MIQHGAEKIINSANNMMVDQDIDEIIRKGEDKTKELNSKYAGLDLDALNSFRSESLINTWEGEDFAAKRRNMIWIEPAKRERKGNYSIDQYYRDNMQPKSNKPDKPKIPRPPKQVHINDFQFFPQRLAELQNREYDAHLVGIDKIVLMSRRKRKTTSFPLATQKRASPRRTLKRSGQRSRPVLTTVGSFMVRLTKAVPLTEEEVAEKEALAEDGFGDWQRRHFHAFIKALERYGRDQMDIAAKEVPDKTEDEVRAYADVFFERYAEIKGGSLSLDHTDRRRREVPRPNYFRRSQDPRAG